MKPTIIIGLLLTLLAGCATINNIDTNGYTAKGSKEKICPYVDGNTTTWRPC